jgi:hypothetical protein
VFLVINQIKFANDLKSEEIANSIKVVSSPKVRRCQM